MQTQREIPRLLRRIRLLLALFIIGLVLSGLTAFPLDWEIDLLHRIITSPALQPLVWPGLLEWITLVRQGLHVTAHAYPFLAYGTDWLAFAHLVIAVAFLGPLRDPVRNIWVIEFGLIASLLVFPLALIMGPLRGIPFFWQLIDCSFGIGSLLLLWPVWRMIKRIERLAVVEPSANALTP